MSLQRRAKGEGTICPRLNGSGFYAQITVGVLPSGNPKRRTVSGKTRGIVQEKLRKLRNKHADGILVEKVHATVEGAVGAWLSSIGDSVSESTHEFYQRYVTNWIVPQIGSLAVQTLEKGNIETVLKHMKESKAAPRTRQIVRGIMLSFLDYAVAEKLIATNVCARVARPQNSTPEFEVWNESESKKFIEACRGERLGPLWVTSLLTGVRIGELLALQPKDFDLKRGRVHIQRTQSIVNKRVVIKKPKTKAGNRSITLTATNLAFLTTWQAKMLTEGHAKRDWFFCDQSGQMLLRGGDVLSSFRRIKKAAGLKHIRIHDLRHTHATLLLRTGENAKVVQERLGHSNVSITLNLYGHVTPDMQTDSASKLEKLLG